MGIRYDYYIFRYGFFEKTMFFNLTKSLEHLFLLRKKTRLNSYAICFSI